MKIIIHTLTIYAVNFNIRYSQQSVFLFLFFLATFLTLFALFDQHFSGKYRKKRWKNLKVFPFFITKCDIFVWQWCVTETVTITTGTGDNHSCNRGVNIEFHVVNFPVMISSMNPEYILIFFLLATFPKKKTKNDEKKI